LSKSGSGGEYNLILTSETIYRQESLGSLLHLLDEGSAPGGDLNVLIRESGKLSLQDGAEGKKVLSEGIRKTESGYLCLVAAKVLYFGVGGGISDFIEAVQSRKPGRSGTVSTVLEKTAGIGRKVLRVEWC
jgi:protein-histidine N-methyltransferase